MITIPGKTQLRDPSDVRRLICKTIRKIEAAGDSAVIDNAGKISQLMCQWLKAFETEKLVDIDKRLKELEAQNALREHK